MRGIVLAGLLFLSPSAAIAGAKITYERYVAANPVDIGTGGTVLTSNGIDYWTSGSPPRKFQILGVIVDIRAEGGRLAGNAVGSKAVAKKVKKVGGDAVVTVSRGSRIEGFSGGGIATRSGSQTYSSGSMDAERSTRTAFAVIKYLP